MNVDEVRAHLKHWVATSLSVPSPHFHGLPPCPYSREALLKSKVDVRLAGSGDFVEELRQVGGAWDDRHVLVLVAQDPRLVDVSELLRRMPELNRHFEGMDLVAFFDHPDCAVPEYQVRHGNGRYLLAGVQRLSAFIEAAKPLHKRSYFEGGTKQFQAQRYLAEPSDRSSSEPE